jgi:two-component system, chemotaxis family, chemotaxis protein CheY
VHRKALELTGWHVEEAEEGRIALAKALGNRPTLLVTETNLPFIDGYELCILLRSDYDTRDTIIVVVTEDADSAHVESARSVGADAVLVKPCLPETLLEQTERLRIRSHGLPEKGAQIGVASSRTSFESAPVPARHGRPIRTLQRTASLRSRPAAPALACSVCYQALRYAHSHVGGVNDDDPERWDYFKCGRCGTFQYRQRTRTLRRVR